MDHSTGALLTPAVAMKLVEADTAALTVSLADGAVRDLSHDELTELVAVGRRAQARIEAALLAAVGEVDARRSYVHDGALSVGAWLRANTRVTPADAAATARTARALRAGLLPATATALAAPPPPAGTAARPPPTRSPSSSPRSSTSPARQTPAPSRQ